MQYTTMPSQRKRAARSKPDRSWNVLLPSTVTPRVIRNAADIAAELIRQAILEGRLHPGEPLREERLAADLAISRTPIREALLILQTEGLVEAAPKRGSVVRSDTPAEIADLYETRAMVEGYASGRAARFVTDSDLEEQVSSFAWIPATHDGCVATDMVLGGQLTEHAGAAAATEAPKRAGMRPQAMASRLLRLGAASV
jgi:DNA-binding transcriptional regulator YhcF (GntR family)